MKKHFLSLFLILSVDTCIYSQQQALPSVADVFGNMSEDEITRQVQMGQKFLEDLEKYGTPEEKAEFEKILLETLNSMSEQDFQDIQNIAKMVEPSLQPVEPQPFTQPAPTPIAVKPEQAAPVISQDATEKIKNLIAAIMLRIDEIIQKIESSKECQEEMQVRWSNRTALSIMKRQIAHLKTTKLAEKLSKKDLSTDDQKLVDTLEAFLKDLTDKNNKLVIEDSFGLSDNKELDQKYLKQTKDILSMFDMYIDSLTPILDKFLNKWDPEALQLAKDASLKSDKAQEEAKASLKRLPSADARPAVQDRSNSQRNAYGNDYNNPYFDYDQYGYSPDMYNQHYQDTQSVAEANPMQNKSNGAAAKSKEINDNIKHQEKKPEGDAVTFDDIMDAIESHFERYNDSSAAKNTHFLNDVVSDGYKALAPALDAKIKTWGTNDQGQDTHTGSKPNVEGLTEWLYNSFVPYTENIARSLETDYQSFGNELDSASRLYSKIEESAKNLSSDEIKKITDKLLPLESRIANYGKVYNTTMDTVKDVFNKNFTHMTDRVIVGDTVQDSSDRPLRAQEVHHKFVTKLQADVGNKISNVAAQMGTLKSSIDRKVKRKSKSSKSSSVIINS